MKLKSLSLKNFRNCETVSLDFESDKTLIIGKNAQGKTNILESIYFLSALKSPRTSNIKDFVKFDKDGFRVEGVLNKSDTDIELEVEYFLNKTKTVKLNGLKTTPKNYKSAFNTVLFSVQDLLLLRGSPQDRRDWLDSAIAQIYPVHDERLSKYNKIRIQKNNLLKEDVVNHDLLDVFNEQLVVVGANIIFTRQKFLSEIKGCAKTVYNNISSDEDFDYEYSFPYHDSEKIAQALREELQTRKNEELARHQACVGPHRDDIHFSINGQDSTKFASQGQQRTVVLALKLAEIDLVVKKQGQSPVLLLDDVLAELDDIRQTYLLKSIPSHTQTIITSVDTLMFEEDFLRNVKIYNVSGGSVIKK